MSAEVLEIPVRIRCEQVAREMREGVIGVLNEDSQAWRQRRLHRAARDLVASVAAIVAHVEGRSQLAA